MWLALLLAVLLVMAVVVAASVQRGRKTPYPTVEDRPPGRD